MGAQNPGSEIGREGVGGRREERQVVSRLLSLRDVRCNGRPKGFVPYSPKGANLVLAERILDLYAAMRRADALPLGPRQNGYRLSQLYPGEYDKNDFKKIETTLKRLAQAGRVDFDEIADASAVVLDPGGYDGPADYLANLPEYRRDLRRGQPAVLEIYAEARETLPLIQRVAEERGVLVYSGSGSGGPHLAYRTAVRAIRRAVTSGQGTLILGICDFDRPGIERILRPHIEHVSAFLHGTDRRGQENGVSTVLAWGAASGPMPIDETDTTVSFQHLALTPEQALELDLVDNGPDAARIERYNDSGGDIWTRDLELLDRVTKIETEALDPRILRQVVTDALETRLDGARLKATLELEQDERHRLDATLHGLRQL
jgi:hypothetical protein